MKKLLTLLLSISILSIINLSAQNAHRYCGHDAVLKKARQDNPNYDREYEEFLQNSLTPENVVRSNDTVYTVQVVFHVLYNPNDPYQNVSDSLIYSQLEALNRDFNMRNEDTVDTRPIFKDLAANARIEFVMAKRRPNGLCTNGINRKVYYAHNNFVPIFLDFLVKEDLFGGSSAWFTKKYLNIWVLDLNKGRAPDTGLLGGYAYFPDMTPMKYNGVVMDYRFFGQDNPYIEDILPSFARYAKGRACVHEVGHWFGLRHIWGDLGTIDPLLGCTADDGIDDTPNSATAYASNGLCSDTIVNSCLDEPVDFPDMFENYMDYSSDDCQSLFTIDQVAVIRNSLLTLRPELIYEPVINTTEVITAEVTENQATSVCFELGDCFGLELMESNFCDSDSNYYSALGAAIFTEDESCITYTAAAFDPNNTVDSFCFVVYDERLDETDTTIVVITILEQCPKSETISTTINENATQTICLDADPCLAEISFSLSFCDINGSFSSDLLDASVSDNCIDIETKDYDANNTTEIVCVIADYNNVSDTTYIEVNIAQATGLNVLSSENNLIEVYPNPTEGLFSIINQTKANEDIQVSIYNMIGAELSNTVIKRGITELDIDISAFSKGIYIIAFETSENISFEKITLK